MKLCTIRRSGATYAARVEGDTFVELPYGDVGALLADPDGLGVATAHAGPARPLDPSTLAPLIVRPPKIICVGMNYAAHIAEMGRKPPSHPTFFAKFTNALIGARDPILLPPESDSVDWEVELAAVIGTPARRVPTERALDHVAGYTVLNDISMRDFQYRTAQFLQGKTFEACTPLGPWLVTADELPPGGSPLNVTCEVDGVVMQDSSTSDLIFSVAELISYFSTITTLEPGDVIATGTPAGVGAGRDPQVFLRRGNVVRTYVEGIGELVNECV
ncbi:MAG TPA: fumarylacetoacetate hydrolase family protein [Ilumatobacter sp.]|nr:fumarylacetoacetate hydrolase family protein [Ilumatobacter sp.]